ncbi:Nucleolar pre-ribosomal-associated protein [Thalictrum thalictroides]|uniref:Nucleolar pre-ribosomal-associated protein n=1 Tax=Thalictrum thalictroides TaxID=46969 RepID=A0A7J6WZC1_THATH|nr:Nucleolar pre-ribosomal-associated protein [Thalictrum thalictroides]
MEEDDDYKIIKQQDNQDKGEGDDCEVEKGKSLKLVLKTSYEAKLRELLRNLYSLEFKIHSEASKEFIKLLRSDSGADLLNQYVCASPSCSELLEAWKLRQGKPGVAHVLSLISVILGHTDGIYKSNDLGRLNLSRKLDKLAHTIIKTKLEDIYTEINSKEPRRQSASLLVMAAVVRRGVGLASEVANKFDFKLPLFPKLAESQQKTGEKRTKFSTRHAFIEFAMSFLEIGNPRLLRWVLQHKDMYFGVLRGLGSDDDDTIQYVLSTLRDRVLTPDSLVPPSLRSVIFGSVTLEQLINISGNSVGEVSARIAHEVLLMVCTDPSNGLMPDFKVYTNALKGNPQRILELLKKLRAAEIGYHKDLLLNIVQGRPSFGSVYMDEFPFLLEPRSSSTWFSAISLAADLVSSTRVKIMSDNKPSLDSSEAQCLLKCIVPRAFSRIAINRGLLHIHVGVRHGTMRLLLEALKSLDSLVTAIDCMSRSNTSLEKWKALKQKVQDEARALLPDCQTLINLLKSVNQNDNKCRDLSLKRPRNSEDLNEIHSSHGVKKLKSNLMDGDCDIIMSGIVPEADNDVSKKGGNDACTFISEELEKEEDCVKVIAGIWGLHNSDVIGNDLRDAEKYFHSKLLDTLTLYLRTMPMVLEQSFPFLTVLPSNPFTLSISQQQSLLSLLLEYIGWSPQSTISSVKPPSLMFKQLHPLLDLLTQSPIKGIQDKAHMLAQAAMLSTGLFDKNRLEMDAWLLFLPVYRRDKSSMGNHPDVVFHDWSKVVVSFLCDAVSTTGNNLYKYMDQLRCLISNLKYFTDVSPNFSPLVICTLNKCLRLLDSDSGKFKLYEKSMISMYVCNTLCFILQTQVDGRLLSSLISSILTERLGDSLVCEDLVTSCEWRPLKNLLHFSRSISLQKDESGDSLCESLQNSLLLSRSVPYPKDGSSSFEKIRSSASFDSFSKVLCASPDEILENLPTVLSVSAHLMETDLSFLSSIFFHERNFLVKIANLWPDILHSGLELVEIAGSTSYRKDDALLEITNQSSSPQESISSRNMKSKDSASVAFSSFLKQASFHLLYPAIMGVSNFDLLCSTKLLDLLKAKLSEGFIADSVASLRLLLFWAHQIQSSYRVAPSSELEHLSKISSILIKHVLEQLFLVQSDGSNLQTFESATVATYIQEIAETIFHHPIVNMSLSNPLCCNKDVRKGSLAESLIDSLDSSNGSVHPISNDIVQLLTTVADHLLGLGNNQNYVFEAEETFDRGLVKAFKTLVQWVILMFKKKFKKPIDSKRLINLLPNFQVFYGLVRIIPPFMLLELVDYIFERSESICLESVKLAAFSVGCYIANGAFNMLSSYVDQLNKGIGRLSQFWEVDAKSFDLTLIEKIYHRVLFLATHSKLECADVCLLKVVNIVYKQKCLPSQTALFPLSMEISRVIMRSPINLVSHCIQGTTATKAKLLFLLTEVSPLHMTLFGKMFICTRNKDLPLKENVDDLQVSGSSIIDQQRLDENGLKSAHQACTNHEDASNSTESLDKQDIRCKQAGRDVGPSDRKQNRKSLLKSFATGENFNDACTDDEFLMLLPIAVAYLQMNYVKFGVSYLRQLQSIPAIYSKILFGGFRNWNGYTSRNIFQEEYDKPSSTEELVKLFHCSMLGKAIHMLQYHITLNVNSLKKKKMMKLFDSICPCSGLPDGFIGFNVDEVKSCSLQQSLNFVNRIVAKITFCRMLLFPKDYLILPLLTEANGHPDEITSTAVSDKLEALTLRFINILVSALHKIVKSFPLVTENSVRLKNTDSSQVFRYLEVFILRNILELSVKMRDNLIQMSDVTFIEQFARSSFLHRFEDPTTLKVLRCVLITVSEGKLSCGVIYELLQAHSKFVSSILWSDSTSSDLLNTGMLLRPMSSVLKYNFFIRADQSADNKVDFETSRSYRQKLEVIKLLRVLYHLKSSQGSIAPVEDTKVNSKELLSLLLSCYGATLSETDLEIFDLMHEIISAEASESVSIAEMDYLWGSSALKLREKTLENSLLFDNTTDCETVEVRRRQQFRENLALDSKRCGATIVNFPYDRLSSRRPILMKKIEENDLMDILEASSDSIERIQRYDPAFILRFAIHGLSMAYIETMEFAGLGLLAIAFMSISSLDEEIRKLGYEALGRFNNALESCRNRKDVSMLRFLLLYLQNGITEPWQRVPSFTAIFVAEASFILLDPSHDHYHTISKLFKNKVKLKCIPLFDEMFGSISKNFKTDRLWILRLSYAGLNSEVDARIFMRNCIVETCLSFYASSLSDYPSKTLILQIVKKSIKLPVLACYLVQKCNLISWLSSVLSSCGERLCEDDKCMFLTEATIILEVVNGVLSVETINEWLKQHALEQLSELTIQALKLFTSGSKIINQNLTLVNLILTVLVSTLRISQERNLNQPHFTFSDDGIFRLYGAADKGSNNTRASSSAELVLRAILTSAPLAVVSQMDGEKLKKIIIWGISTASKSYSKGISSKESDFCLKEICGKEVCEESQMSILLRWVTASVILGSISRKSLKKTFFLPERSNLQSLQMLLEHTKKVNREVEGDDREVSEIQCRNNEGLAATILYLQQLLGINCKVLPSVVSALCLLLLPHSVRNTGTVSLDEDQIELVASMCSKIRCPAETNPAWQWVYDQPKEEHQSVLAGPGKMKPDNIVSELTELQNMEERHACEELLLIFSNALKGKSSKSQLLSHLDLNACGVFTWERNILVNQVLC